MKPTLSYDDLKIITGSLNGKDWVIVKDKKNNVLYEGPIESAESFRKILKDLGVKDA
jgi:hypothetical protein